MKKIQKVSITVTIFLLSISVYAQSGTNSPYSMYGIGILSDRGQGFNRAMSSVAQGFRYGNQVNVQNPASFSAVDSLSFIFDIGMSLQSTNFAEGSTKLNAKQASFEYAVAAFRACKNLGVSFGVLPFSNIGYDFSRKTTITAPVEDTYTSNYLGDGGIREAYIGAGYRPFKPISIGFTMGYLWGDYDKYVINTHSVTSSENLNRNYTSEIHSYNLNMALQYIQPIGKDNTLTVGATYTLGHNLKNTATLFDIMNDSTEYFVENAMSLPHSISAGIAFHHAKQWSIGADFILNKFGSEKYPIVSDNGDKMVYELKDGLLKNRQKFVLGGEIVPNELSRNFFSRIHYRVGGFYSTPYVKMNLSQGLVDGPKEYGVSFGFGIPVINSYNNRSLLNITGQWTHRSAKNYIKENCFMINIGMTFNERWFAKWKLD